MHFIIIVSFLVSSCFCFTGLFKAICRFSSAMCDSNLRFSTNPFLKSVLFAQVFKASVALSILHTCPTHLKEDEFTIQLQKANRFYERYKDRLFYHANQIVLPWVDNLSGTECQVSLYGYEPALNFHEGALSQLITNVASTRVGFRGLLEAKGPIHEKHIVPGLLTLVKALSWMDKFRVNLKGKSLLNQLALLHAETSDAFRVTGEIVAKLDTEELSTVEIARCFPFILSSACSVKGEGRSGCWIYPVRSFVGWYWRFVYENADCARTLHFANSLAKHLLNRIFQLLELSNEDSRLQTQSLNESFARLYALTMPALRGFRRRSNISRNLMDTVSETNDIIRQIKVDRKEYTWLSNGSLILLQSMKSKLQHLNSLSE